MTFFVKTKTKTLGLKTKTKTLFFVLEVPRDQDFGLEDYITGVAVFIWSVDCDSSSVKLAAVQSGVLVMHD